MLAASTQRHTSNTKTTYPSIQGLHTSNKKTTYKDLPLRAHQFAITGVPPGLKSMSQCRESLWPSASAEALRGFGRPGSASQTLYMATDFSEQANQEGELSTTQLFPGEILLDHGHILYHRSHHPISGSEQRRNPVHSEREHGTSVVFCPTIRRSYSSDLNVDYRLQTHYHYRYVRDSQRRPPSLSSVSRSRLDGRRLGYH